MFSDAEMLVACLEIQHTWSCQTALAFGEEVAEGEMG